MLIIIKKNIEDFGEGLTQELVDTNVPLETKYPTNFKHSRKRFALCLHYHGRTSFFFFML